MIEKLREKYKAKCRSVDEVLALIKSGDVIGCGFAGIEPMAVLAQLHTIKDRVRDVTVWYSLLQGRYEFLADPAMKPHFSGKTLFYGWGDRQAHKHGMVSYFPNDLHNSSLRSRDESHPTDVYITSVAPMDKHGYFNLSLSSTAEKLLINNASKVIVEVNPRLPRSAGDTEVHIDCVDYIVEVDRPVPYIPKPEISEPDRQIGEYVASLVNDGDTIQLGIGGIPEAVAASFMKKHDLGVHTEMLTSSMGELARAGVITGRRKNFYPGKMVATFALGNQDLYDFIDNNPSVILMPQAYVNNPFVVAKNDNMVSINTALQIDLTGQVCSESIGIRQWSGSGGQSDMATGAIHAQNGRSIIALAATAKNGTVSTIQPWLTPGAAVTMSRNTIDYIITEYGIALMKGKTVRERVDNLIAVAHPDFRKELRDTAFKHEIW